MFLILRVIEHLLRRAALAMACAAGLVAPASAGLRDYPLGIEEVKGARHIELVAHNRGPATMTVYLTTIAGENMISDVAWPIVRAVPPYASVSLGRIFPQEANKAGRLRYTRSMQYGDYRAVHSPDTHYRLPYRHGEAHRITQAYGDPLTTHVGHDSQHAVDFAMAEGTPVVATRDGVVIDVTLDYEAGGTYQDLKDKANAVAIQHEDGTVAVYAHLSKRSSPVAVGQRVAAGTVIGYSGSTGYSSGPHLHYEVTKPELLADGRVVHVALPIKFYVDTWALPFEPRRGTLVTAAYSRDSAPGAAAAPAGAAERPARDVVEASSIPVRAFHETAAGQSASGPDVRVPVTVSSTPVQVAPPLQQAAVQPAPQATRPSPVNNSPPVVHHVEVADHSMPGPLEAALMLLGGAFALVIPVVFWRRARA